MFHIHGGKLILELYEWTLGLLFQWRCKHIQTHHYGVFCKQHSQNSMHHYTKEVQCFEVFFSSSSKPLLLFSYLFFSYGHHFLRRPLQMHSQSTTIHHARTSLLYAFFSALNNIRPLLSCFISLA